MANLFFKPSAKAYKVDMTLIDEAYTKYFMQ